MARAFGPGKACTQGNSRYHNVVDSADLQSTVPIAQGRIPCGRFSGASQAWWIFSGMNTAAADNLQIGPVSAEDRAEAFELVFSRMATDERRPQVDSLVTTTASGEVSAEGLLGARRHGRLVGAVFSQVQPGKTAVVWPPRLVSGEPEATAAELLAATCKQLADHRVRIAQSLLSTVTEGDERLLRGADFQPLADLLYLVSLEGEFPTTGPTTPLEFEPYSPANHDRLAQIVNATYQQTRDCPQLNGVRQIEDVLTGYRHTGVFDGGRWLIVRYEDQDVGCLLLADHPEHGNWELVYMGLMASCRGHGWGMDIARHAQWLTRQAGRPRLVLAVDADNHPAITIYSTVGFQAWDRRSAYLKVFPPAD